MLWWSADTGSSNKVRDWLLELLTVKSYLIPDMIIVLIHSIVAISMSVEHTIDTVSPMVSGIAMELIRISGEGQQVVSLL